MDIVRQALRLNTLVVLPTGTGKTLIAAVVIYNFHRWFKKPGKIVFLAPTRPLVAQQIGACRDATWLSESHMTELTGAVSVSQRADAWASDKRVFFCTPQTFENDLAAGRCAAQDIVCLVIDEAHKAQGEYAYVGVVKAIAEKTNRFRVLALTATPGSDRSKIQQVISSHAFLIFFSLSLYGVEIGSGPAVSPPAGDHKPANRTRRSTPRRRPVSAAVHAREGDGGYPGTAEQRAGRCADQSERAGDISYAQAAPLPGTDSITRKATVGPDRA